MIALSFGILGLIDEVGDDRIGQRTFCKHILDNTNFGRSRQPTLFKFRYLFSREFQFDAIALSSIFKKLNFKFEAPNQFVTGTNVFR